MNAAAETNGGGDTCWKDSYKTAQMITLPDVTRICGEKAGQLVHDLAQGVGCPDEFVLMPLLSCCSALMGHRSEIRVHAAWSEPPVLWVIVGAGAGTRKSAALRQILAPLLALADDRKQQQQQQQGLVTAGLQLPVVYTGSMGPQHLRVLSHEGSGRVLHVTERLEDSHRQMGMHALHAENLKASRAQLHDLYEAFARNLGLTQSPVHGGSAGETCGTLSRAVFYNQCGFASPEYVVNLIVKAPCWLSGRFLVSCPSVDGNATTTFSVSGQNDAEEEEEEEEEEAGSSSPKRARRDKRLTLKDLYFHIARVHSQPDPRRYQFTKDAVRELQRFHEEEWCTIINQLGGEDNRGVVAKSLGQIVRLAGVLKAINEASKPDLDYAMRFQTEKVNHEEGAAVKINSEDVTRAVEMGKYFLEQKLSMTFMVSTGFFRRSGSSHQQQQQQQQQQQAQDSRPLSAPQSSDYAYMPPPEPVNSLYGFPKLANFLPQAAAALSLGTAVPSSPHPSQHHHHHHHHSQGVPVAASLASSSPSSSSSSSTSQSHHHPGFPFSVPVGVPASSAHALSSVGTRSSPHHPLPPPSSSPSQSSPTVPPSSSSSSSSSHPAHTPPEIDVAQLPATWIPATPEEEMAEMSQAAEFVQLEPTQFVAVHARRVKRLLECFDDGCGVSATTAAQKSIAPPVRVAGTNNRHPAWASALFFQKVADLGLGVAEQVRHPTNGRVYWRFKRKTVAELTEKNFQLLHYLRIDMGRYARLGQPSLHVPGLDGLGEPVAAGGGRAAHSLGEEGSNSSSKANGSPLEQSEIKQEMV